ncbi:DUF4279 domain-containing protein [Stenotrophomonas chelatiphaga]|nr:DUF4279 domain-containing protein [Stenotrophomonas chelatiphaga]MCS4231150.1 hypothetical protein [Stenotrophomonas chelatiphaga]
MSADALIQKIGLQPEIACSVGSRRANPSGELLDGFYPTSYCCFDMVREGFGDFTEALAPLLDQLDGKEDAFRQIASTGGRSELYVGVFVEGSSGFTLTGADIKRLAELSLELSVEVYP